MSAEIYAAKSREFMALAQKCGERAERRRLLKLAVHWHSKAVGAGVQKPRAESS